MRPFGHRMSSAMHVAPGAGRPGRAEVVWAAKNCSMPRRNAHGWALVVGGDGFYRGMTVLEGRRRTLTVPTVQSTTRKAPHQL